MINGLIEPTAGRVAIDGWDVLTLDPVELRRGIGYVFQGIGLFPHMTVADNVAVVPRLLGWTLARTAERVDQPGESSGAAMSDPVVTVGRVKTATGSRDNSPAGSSSSAWG